MKLKLHKYTIAINSSTGPLIYITKQRLDVEEQVYPVPCRCWSAEFHPPTDEFRCFIHSESLPRCAFCGRKRCPRVDAFGERYLDGYNSTTLNYVCEHHAPWHDRFLKRYRHRPMYGL